MAREPQDIYIVCGLGNPGEKYEGTRHNAGFTVIDELAHRFGVSYWKNEHGADTAVITIGERDVLLAKPMSFMNRSGGPLSKLCRSYDVLPQELLVIHDELDFEPGEVKIKFSGGHAGHNGLKSITEKLMSKEFSRVRVGIGRPPGRMSVSDYVLSFPRGKEDEALQVAYLNAADAVEDAVRDGVVHARNKWNSR